jgi:hypothetical protein
MEEIVLIIDTSILKKHISLKTTEFELIAELSRINAIKFKIPEMVNKEFLSHRIAEIKIHYNNILTSLKQLQKKTLLKDIQIDNEIKKFEDANNKELTALEKEWINYRRKKNISIIPFSVTSTNRVFKDYFNGNPPFKNVKNRNDIPDSFILYSILSLSNKSNLYFVCGDKTLTDAVSKNNIKTYESLSDFLGLQEIKLKLKELEDLSLVNNEFKLIKDNEVLLNNWVTNYLKKSIPIELFNTSGTPSKHKDKLVDLYEIKSINFDFDKARLYNSNILVIPSSINVSIELEMIYSHDEYLKLSSQNVFHKVLEIMKQKENEEGVTVKEPYSGDLNLSLKFNLSSPFELKEENVSYSDITKEFLMTDLINEVFK